MSSFQSNLSVPSVGALLKSAWIILKARFWVLLGIELVPAVVVLVLALLASFSGLATQGRTPPTGLFLVIAAILVVVGLVFQLWAQTALLYAIKDHGERIGIRESFRRGWKQLHSFWWLSILLMLIMVGGIALLIIPGLILGIWFVFAPFVLIDEKRRGNAALWVSREYVRGVWWKVWGRIIFLTLIGLIIIGIIYVPIIVTVGQSAAAQNILQFVNLIFSIVWGPFALAYTFSIYRALKKAKGPVPVVVMGGKKAGLIVLTVWGLLVIMIVIGAMIFSSGLSEARTKARYAKADADLRYLQAIIELYREEKGEYPQYLKDLEHAGLVTVMPKDPATGQLYQYTPSLEGTEYELCGSTGRTPEQGQICYTSPGLQPTLDSITDPRVYIP